MCRCEYIHEQTYLKLSLMPAHSRDIVSGGMAESTLLASMLATSTQFLRTCVHLFSLLVWSYALKKRQFRLEFRMQDTKTYANCMRLS